MKWLRKFSPIISVGAAIALQQSIPDSPLQPPAAHPYYRYALFAVAISLSVAYALSFASRRTNAWLSHRGPFLSGAILSLQAIGMATQKFALFPVLYFPSYDRILAVFAENWPFLAKCALYSLRLLVAGFFFGSLAGFATGILLGFSKKAEYWINPVFKFIGPIPTTAWIPIVLTGFPTTFSASVFLIALAVWFPTTLMTAGGIQNIQPSYFEVARTLGAMRRHHVFLIGVPAAMPNIFLGLFNGTCAAFITLMTAEMFGAPCGIGWYVNWQKQMMVYPGVYAGLIVIGIVCSIVIFLLFKARVRLLSWQKGAFTW